MDCSPVLFAPDTLYQPDSLELLCSVDGIVYLVREKTGNRLSEIYEAKIDFSLFQKGVYIITIKSEDLLTTGKIIKPYYTGFSSE